MGRSLLVKGSGSLGGSRRQLAQEEQAEERMELGQQRVDEQSESTGGFSAGFSAHAHEEGSESSPRPGHSKSGFHPIPANATFGEMGGAAP